MFLFNKGNFVSIVFAVFDTVGGLSQCRSLTFELHYSNSLAASLWLAIV